jgi:hypothetical protein
MDSYSPKQDGGLSLDKEKNPALCATTKDEAGWQELWPSPCHTWSWFTRARYSPKVKFINNMTHRHACLRAPVSCPAFHLEGKVYQNLEFLGSGRCSESVSF